MGKRYTKKERGLELVEMVVFDTATIEKESNKVTLFGNFDAKEDQKGERFGFGGLSGLTSKILGNSCFHFPDSYEARGIMLITNDPTNLYCGKVNFWVGMKDALGGIPADLIVRKIGTSHLEATPLGVNKGPLEIPSQQQFYLELVMPFPMPETVMLRAYLFGAAWLPVA